MRVAPPRSEDLTGVWHQLLYFQQLVGDLEDNRLPSEVLEYNEDQLMSIDKFDEIPEQCRDLGGQALGGVLINDQGLTPIPYSLPFYYKYYKWDRTKCY